MTSVTENVVAVEELSREEAYAGFERVVDRSALDMSAAEFLTRYRRGDYDSVEPDSIDGLASVMMAIPVTDTV